MPKYSYITVEGPHDVAFVARFLKLAGLSHIQKLTDLDPFWAPLVPREFPHQDDLLKRIPTPWFFSNHDFSVAISSAIGETRISENIEEIFSISNWGLHDLEGLGVVLDADIDHSPEERFNTLKREIQGKIPEIALPDAPGVVSANTPHSGIFITPNNSDPGALEDILIQCAEFSYSGLLTAADCFINRAASEINNYTHREKRDFLKPTGVNKATVSAIANILRPGKAVQVSIQDNKWIARETLDLPVIALFNEFIRQLTGISKIK